MSHLPSMGNTLSVLNCAGDGASREEKRQRRLSKKRPADRPTCSFVTPEIGVQQNHPVDVKVNTLNTGLKKSFDGAAPLATLDSPGDEGSISADVDAAKSISSNVNESTEVSLTPAVTTATLLASFDTANATTSATSTKSEPANAMSEAAESCSTEAVKVSSITGYISPSLDVVPHRNSDIDSGDSSTQTEPETSAQPPVSVPEDYSTTSRRLSDTEFHLLTVASQVSSCIDR